MDLVANAEDLAANTEFAPGGTILPHSSSGRRPRDANTSASGCAGPLDFPHTTSQGRDR